MSKYHNGILTVVSANMYSSVTGNPREGDFKENLKQGIKNITEYDGSQQIPYIGDVLSIKLRSTHEFQFNNGEREQPTPLEADIYIDIPLSPKTEIGQKQVEWLSLMCKEGTEIENNGDLVLEGTGLVIKAGATVEATLCEWHSQSGKMGYNVYAMYTIGGMPAPQPRATTAKVSTSSNSFLSKIKANLGQVNIKDVPQAASVSPAQKTSEDGTVSVDDDDCPF